MKMSESKSNQDRRAFERFIVRLTVKLKPAGEEQATTAYTHDICAKGIGLISQQQLNRHTPLELWLDIPDCGEPLYMKGEVVWSEPIESNGWKVGISLEQADLMGISRIFRARNSY